MQPEGIVAKYWINESDNSLNKDERTKISYKWYFSGHLHELQGMEDTCWGVAFLPVALGALLSVPVSFNGNRGFRVK